MESRLRDRIQKLLSNKQAWFLLGGGLALLSILLIALFLPLPSDEPLPQPSIEVPVATIQRPTITAVAAATARQDPGASTDKPYYPFATATPAGAHPMFHPVRGNKFTLSVTDLGVWISTPDILAYQAVVAMSSKGPVIMAPAHGVLYCEHIVIFAPGAVTETMPVHPAFHPYVGARQITVVPAQETLSWGCQIPSGEVLRLSLGGYLREYCKATERGWVVDIVSFPKETLLIVSDDCWKLRNTKMVWIDNQTGLETRSKNVGLIDNWIVFGNFVCAGGKHPHWKLCVSTQTGEQVSPTFLPTKSTTITLQGGE